MHKRTHLQVAESRAHHTAKPLHPRQKANRRRNWNRTLQLFAVFLAIGDLAALAFAPGLRVTKVRVDGAQTLTPQQVFEDAQVPNHTNLLWMLRQPFTKRLAADPVIDHAERSVRLPNLLILTITERQPFAVLSAAQNGAQQFWLLDSKGVPYRQLDRPPPHLPVIDVADAAMPGDITLGRPLGEVWLPDAYRLLALTQTDPKLSSAKIAVDQNLNLCLNRKGMPQIRFGQPDSLRWKMSLIQAALSAYGGALSQRAAYIDVSCPQQPVWRPRSASNTDIRSN
jgi:cell division septal protein FtsQ